MHPGCSRRAHVLDALLHCLCCLGALLRPRLLRPLLHVCQCRLQVPAPVTLQAERGKANVHPVKARHCACCLAGPRPLHWWWNAVKGWQAAVDHTKVQLLNCQPSAADISQASNTPFTPGVPLMHAPSELAWRLMAGSSSRSSHSATRVSTRICAGVGGGLCRAAIAAVSSPSPSSPLPLRLAAKGVPGSPSACSPCGLAPAARACCCVAAAVGALGSTAAAGEAAVPPLLPVAAARRAAYSTGPAALRAW